MSPSSPQNRKPRITGRNRVCRGAQFATFPIRLLTQFSRVNRARRWCADFISLASDGIYKASPRSRARSASRSISTHLRQPLLRSSFCVSVHQVLCTVVEFSICPRMRKTRARLSSRDNSRIHNFLRALRSRLFRIPRLLSLTIGEICFFHRASTRIPCISTNPPFPPRMRVRNGYSVG